MRHEPPLRTANSWSNSLRSPALHLHLLTCFTTVRPPLYTFIRATRWLQRALSRRLFSSSSLLSPCCIANSTAEFCHPRFSSFLAGGLIFFLSAFRFIGVAKDQKRKGKVISKAQLLHWVRDCTRYCELICVCL